MLEASFKFFHTYFESLFSSMALLKKFFLAFLILVRKTAKTCCAILKERNNLLHVINNVKLTVLFVILVIPLLPVT
jgi:hypothetical protein